MHRLILAISIFSGGHRKKTQKVKKEWSGAYPGQAWGRKRQKGILAKIVETIAKGTDIEEQKSLHGQGEKRIRIHYDGHTAVLSATKGTKGENSWLLTGWEDKGPIKQREAGAHVRGGVTEIPLIRADQCAGQAQAWRAAGTCAGPRRPVAYGYTRPEKAERSFQG